MPNGIHDMRTVVNWLAENAIYKTIENKLVRLEEFEDGAWINITDPTVEEIESMEKKFNIEHSYLVSAMDEEERSRIEVNDENQTFSTS